MVRVDLPEGTGRGRSRCAGLTTPQGTLLLVKDVPACGYRVLKLAASQRGTAADTAAGTKAT